MKALGLTLLLGYPRHGCMPPQLKKENPKKVIDLEFRIG